MKTKQSLKSENQNPELTDLETLKAYIAAKSYITALEIHIDLLNKIIKSKDEQLKKALTKDTTCSN